MYSDGKYSAIYVCLDGFVNKVIKVWQGDINQVDNDNLGINAVLHSYICIYINIIYYGDIISSSLSFFFVELLTMAILNIVKSPQAKLIYCYMIFYLFIHCHTASSLTATAII